MILPLRDPQFWIVSAVAAAAIFWLVRLLLPGSRKGRARPTRVSLTIAGGPPPRRDRGSG